jgi:hypothetical protein
MSGNKTLQSIKDIIPESEIMFHVNMDALIEESLWDTSTEKSVLIACFHILQKFIEVPKEDWEITIWSMLFDIPKDEIIRQIKKAG